jgi:hypothetical protein
VPAAGARAALQSFRFRERFLQRYRRNASLSPD